MDRLHRLFMMIFACIGIAGYVSANADESHPEQPEAVSFYGLRGISTPQNKPKTETQYYRRTIAPPIPIEPDVTPTNSIIDAFTEAEFIYPLTRNELLLAKKAQFYFERNYRERTGFWDSVQGYPHTTMWDIASGIAATLALEGLELTGREETQRNLARTLKSLNALPLYRNTLPNREYSTKTALPSGRLSDTITNGNGWSALDIGRLLIWLKILTQQYPEFIPDVEQLTNKWQLDKAVHNGTLYGTNYYKGKEYYRQEGRNGYLQYASRGFELFDYRLPHPNLEQYLLNVEISGTPISTDTRNVPFLTSDPYVLASIEFGRDDEWNQVDNFYDLHRSHSEKNGKLYSYAEDAMNKNPWFAYNNLYYYGKPWTSVSPSGKTIENPQIFSHKVAFGYSVLFDDSFSQQLFDTVLDNSLHSRSIPTGQYENGGMNTAFNINTNSLILVALWYKQNGQKPIYQPKIPTSSHPVVTNLDIEP